METVIVIHFVFDAAQLRGALCRCSIATIIDVNEFIGIFAIQPLFDLFQFQDFHDLLRRL